MTDPSLFESEVEREWRRFPFVASSITDIAGVRANLGEHFHRVATRPTRPSSDVTVEDVTAPSHVDGHPIPVRIYRPPGPLSGRGLLNIHGGAFVFGDLELEDENCRGWAEQAQCVVVAVDYRLAPEHPYPVPLEDCYSVLLWTAEHAEALGIDPGRLAIGGCSAGGALTAGLALLTRDRNGPPIALQMLLYPVLDASMDTASIRSNSELEIRDMERMWESYLGGPRAEATTYASPASANDLAGLPPAYIVAAEFDALRDEAMAYAQALMNAGVSVELHVWAKVPHAFELFVPDAGLARRAVREQADALTRFLG